MRKYDLAYLTLAPVVAGFISYKRWRHGKYRECTPAMLGRRLAEEDPQFWSNGSIWVHAVSVGETIAARAMLPLLRESYPDLRILLTTHTETGQAQARKFEGELVDAVRYYPFDFSWVVRQFIDTYQPRLFLPMETELWPNALLSFREAGIPSIVLNGKISESSFRSYQRLRGLLKPAFHSVSAWCVQTEADARRVSTLTGHEADVHVTGNCKFDSPLPVVDEQTRRALKDELQLTEGYQLVVVGSTHAGEEEFILESWEQVLRHHPEALMLLVPRHPERFDEVWQKFKTYGLSSERLSNRERQGSGNTTVVLVDKMGILASLYALADVAVVAGSFVPGIGGHNLLEAAGHGVPVIYGPHMKKQPDMVRILTPDNGGTVASTPAELADSMSELLSNKNRATELGERGRLAFLQHRGAAARNMEIIRRHFQG